MWIYPHRRGRGRRPPSGGRPWQFSLFGLFVLTTICAVWLSVGQRFPLEALILSAIVVVSATCVVLYIGELVVVGWIVDFLSWVTAPIRHVKQSPLAYEQFGAITVVKLSDNIVTAVQCHTVDKQLKRLLDKHQCDFILDFSSVGKVSVHFREVMIRLTKAARREAEKLGKAYRPFALPPGDIFRVFADRATALEEMGNHDGHGWVVLCSVPVGVRAVPEAI